MSRCLSRSDVAAGAAGCNEGRAAGLGCRAEVPDAGATGDARLSLEQTEYLLRDRLSWMPVCGLDLGDAVPDANTLWDSRGVLICAAGYLTKGGEILDATLVTAPR